MCNLAKVSLINTVAGMIDDYAEQESVESFIENSIIQTERLRQNRYTETYRVAILNAGEMVACAMITVKSHRAQTEINEWVYGQVQQWLLVQTPVEPVKVSVDSFIDDIAPAHRSVATEEVKGALFSVNFVDWHGEMCWDSFEAVDAGGRLADVSGIYLWSQFVDSFDLAQLESEQIRFDGVYDDFDGDMGWDRVCVDYDLEFDVTLDRAAA